MLFPAQAFNGLQHNKLVPEVQIGFRLIQHQNGRICASALAMSTICSSPPLMWLQSLPLRYPIPISSIQASAISQSLFLGCLKVPRWAFLPKITISACCRQRPTPLPGVRTQSSATAGYMGCLLVDAVTKVPPVFHSRSPSIHLSKVVFPGAVGSQDRQHLGFIQGEVYIF